MEKSRKAKKSVLIVLLLLVVGLTIGFAAFTSQLTISSSASVKGNSTNFKVVFSESNSSVTGNTTTMGGNATAAGTFSGTSLTGLKAEFTAPGQTATWELYAYNDGQFDAFLKDVTIGEIKGTAVSGTTQSYVDEAVKGLSISVKVDDKTTYSATTNDISSNNDLAKGEGEKVLVTLTYSDTAAIADGDFTVTIGDIKLNYESVN